MSFEVSLTGDAIINRDVSFCEDERFLELVELTRDADVAYTHLETVCHDYDDPEVYPAAVSGGTWVRSPTSIGRELDWAGFDLVSHASNHALDYSYGGLRETWRALDDAGVAHAGTGENLAAAREPAIVDTPRARIALVSATSSFPRWGRAGEARGDVRGRPGVNPLRTYRAVGPDRAAQLCELGEAFGLIVTETDEELALQRPESRNAVYRFRKVDAETDDATGRRIHERDRAGTLQAVADAATTCDLVIAHVHAHEFRAGGSIQDPPRFLERFARDAADAGADVVVVQGSHAPVRGIEVRDGTPVLYDPGDYFVLASTVTRQPADFYYRYEDALDVHPADATPTDGLRARGFTLPWEGSGFSDEDRMSSPRGGFFTGPGSVLARCRFDDDLEPTELVLHPVRWFSEPKALTGLPRAVDGDRATEILAHVADLSAAYGTTVAVDEDDGVARIEL